MPTGAWDTEYTGPVEVWGTRRIPHPRLWNVHGKFLTHAIYANGVTMDISGDLPNGIKFLRHQRLGLRHAKPNRPRPPTPAANPTGGPKATGLDASDPKILESVIGPDEIQLYKSGDQHGNWLDCIRTRQAPNLSG